MSSSAAARHLLPGEKALANRARPFEIDHIISKKRYGPTVAGNLAFSSFQGAYLIGRTPVGCITVALFHINDAYRVELRLGLIDESVFPPDDGHGDGTPLTRSWDDIRHPRELLTDLSSLQNRDMISHLRGETPDVQREQSHLS